jgi:hypothetical protein
MVVVSTVPEEERALEVMIDEVATLPATLVVSVLPKAD